MADNPTSFLARALTVTIMGTSQGKDTSIDKMKNIYLAAYQDDLLVREMDFTFLKDVCVFVFCVFIVLNVFNVVPP